MQDYICSSFTKFFKNDSLGFLSRHRLFPDDLKIEFLPFPGENSWVKHVTDLTKMSLYLSEVFLDIVEYLRIAGVDVIALKGPVLAFALFEDVGKRYFGDLDFLVSDEDLTKVISVLANHGFRQSYPKAELTEKQKKYYFKWKKDIGLVNGGKRIFLELHTGIYYHELVTLEKEHLFFEDTIEETLAGTDVRCMNRDNTFLYLTFHGSLHMYCRLFWLRDVAEALKRWELNHAKILNNAYELGIERLLGLSLELSRDFFGAEIPREYKNLLEENASTINMLKNFCVKRILGPEELSLMGKIRKHYYMMSLKPGIKYKYIAFISIFHRWYIRKFMGGN